MEGRVEGKNCRGRQNVEYKKQIIEGTGYGKYIETKKLVQERNTQETKKLSSGKDKSFYSNSTKNSILINTNCHV